MTDGHDARTLRETVAPGTGPNAVTIRRTGPPAAAPIAGLFALVLALEAGACGPTAPVATPSGPASSPAAPSGSAPVPSAPVPSSPAAPDATASASSDLDRELADSEAYRARREALVDRFIEPYLTDPRVIAAMRAVQRHSFVPRDQLDQAYQDYPLPIGYGQTISQPSLVAEMTELLELDPGERVLEIGTGSGYQAAILAELTDAVFSVEIVPQLAGTARSVLDALGYGTVRTDRRDGYFGWEDHAPYDAIVVTAAPDHLPSPLVDQLLPGGGRMVIPIGPPGDVQTLWLVTREGEDVRMERVAEVVFVPFVREGS